MSISLPGGMKETVTRRRYAEGDFVDQYWVSGATTDVSIEASVQPLSGQQVESLSEGQRLRAPKFIMTDSELKLVDEVAKTPADHIVADGIEYVLETLEHFKMGLADHFEGIMLRVNR